MARIHYLIYHCSSLLTCLFFLMLSSCTIVHQGMITGSTPIQNSDVVFVDNAVGYSRTLYLLGYGGYRTPSLTQEAKQKLYANYPLKSGESFENLTLTERRTFFPFVVRSEVILYADIVRRDTAFSVSFSQAYRQKLAPFKVDSTSFFQVNQQVRWLSSGNKVVEATVIDVTDRVHLLLDDRSRLKIKSISQNAVFAIEDPAGYFIVNKEISFLDPFDQIKTGHLVGFNTTNLLILSGGKYLMIPIRLASPNSI
jgi:hypothetical protein